MATSGTHCCWKSIKLVLILSIYLPAMVPHCDAGRSIDKHNKELKSLRHFDEMYPSLDSAYGIGSPFSLPPFESLAPVSMPQQGQTTPPYCINPPVMPTPTNPYSPPAPSLYIPPIFPILSPPSQPSANPYPPPQSTLTPPSYVPSTPPGFEPSPPSYTPTPGGGSGGAPGGGGGGGSGGGGSGGTPIGGGGGSGGGGSGGTPIGGGGGSGGGGSGGTPGGGGGGGFAPNPPTFIKPSPPVFQPPVIFPPPAVPPPPHHGESLSLWCVAKPSVPDPIIQEAMNYACGSGADCNPIQANGNCYQPNTLLAHASYAFNSYWQMTKVGGGTCEFGGTAILVTVDPSHDGCHFPIT